jgi:hypothetical protein
MLVVQFLIMGRPCELGYLTYESLSYDEITRTAYISTDRTKVGRHHEHAACSTPMGNEFVDYHSDVLHAAGTHMFMGAADGMKNKPLFPLSQTTQSKKRKRSDKSDPEKVKSSSSYFCSYITSMFEKLSSVVKFTASSTRGAAAR